MLKELRHKERYTAAVLGDLSDGHRSVHELLTFREGEQRYPSERQLVAQKTHRQQPILLVEWEHRESVLEVGKGARLNENCQNL